MKSEASAQIANRHQRSAVMAMQSSGWGSNVMVVDIAVAVQPQTQVAALHNVVPKAPVVKVLRSGGRDGCAWWAVVPVLLGSVQLD